MVDQSYLMDECIQRRKGSGPAKAMNRGRTSIGDSEKVVKRGLGFTSFGFGSASDMQTQTRKPDPYPLHLSNPTGLACAVSCRITVHQIFSSTYTLPEHPREALVLRGARVGRRGTVLSVSHAKLGGRPQREGSRVGGGLWI